MCIDDYDDIISKTSNPAKFKYQLNKILKLIKDRELEHLFDDSYVISSAEHFLNTKFTPTLSNYILRYGEGLGNELFRQFRVKSVNSPEKFKRLYGDDWEIKWDIYRKKSTQSIDNFILRYGKELGAIKFSEYSKKHDSSSLKFFIDKYGEELGHEKYIEKCKTIKTTGRHDKVKYINKKTGLDITQEEYDNAVENSKKYILSKREAKILRTKYEASVRNTVYPNSIEDLLVFASKRINFERVSFEGLTDVVKNNIHSFLVYEFYDYLQDFIDDLINVCGTLLSNNVVKSGNSNLNNYISYTDNGSILRSSSEIYLYKLLKSLGVKVIANKKYPDSNMFFDFYLPDFNYYIELAEMYEHDKEYQEVIDFKIKNFNAIMLSNRDEINSFYYRLKDQIEIEYIKGFINEDN